MAAAAVDDAQKHDDKYNRGCWLIFAEGRRRLYPLRTNCFLLFLLVFLMVWVIAISILFVYTTMAMVGTTSGLSSPLPPPEQYKKNTENHRNDDDDGSSSTTFLSKLLKQQLPVLLRTVIPFQHRIELTEVSIPVNEQQHSSLRGTLSFAQISDIHSDIYNEALSEHVLKSLAWKMKRYYERKGFDFLVITGDFVHHEVEQSVKRLKTHFFDQLPPELPVYGSLGNHDLIDGKKQLLIHLLNTTCGVHVLDNDFIELRDGKVLLVGVGDYIHNGGSDFHYEYVKQKWNTRKQQRKQQEQEQQQQQQQQQESFPYVITLSHNPISAECLLDDKTSRGLCDFGANVRSDLVCSGHTHASQVLIPFIRKPILPIIYHLLPESFHNRVTFFKNFYQAIGKWEWLQGLIPFGGGGNTRFLYVNRGIGAHLGFRFACRPEITLFHFV